MPKLDCDPAKYSAKCIAEVAAQAGFDKDRKTLETAVAVALAESSGRTQVVNAIGCCVGLWQINTKVHSYTTAQMKVPSQNAAAAWDISNGGSTWRPWSAYLNGSYLVYMPTAKAAVRSRFSSSGTVETSGGEDDESEVGHADFNWWDAPQVGLEAVLAFPRAVRDWLSDRDNIFRIIKVVGGVLVVVVGAFMVAKPVVQGVAGGVVKGVTKGVMKGGKK